MPAAMSPWTLPASAIPGLLPRHPTSPRAARRPPPDSISTPVTAGRFRTVTVSSEPPSNLTRSDCAINWLSVRGVSCAITRPWSISATRLHTDSASAISCVVSRIVRPCAAVERTRLRTRSAPSPDAHPAALARRAPSVRCRTRTPRHSASPAFTSRSAFGSCNSGVMSRNRIPGCGKSGTSRIRLFHRATAVTSTMPGCCSPQAGQSTVRLLSRIPRVRCRYDGYR